MNPYIFASFYNEEIVNNKNQIDNKIIIEQYYVDRNNLNTSNLIVEDLSYSKDEFVQSYNYIKKNKKRFLNLLIEEIQVHNKNLNINLIRSSLEFWLIHYISTIKIRFDKLTYLKNKYKKISLPTLKDEKIEFADTADFISKVASNERINGIIYQKIGELIGVSFVEIFINSKIILKNKKKLNFFTKIKNKLYLYLILHVKLNINFDLYVEKKKIVKIYEFFKFRKIYLSAKILKKDNKKLLNSSFFIQLNNNQKNLSTDNLEFVLLKLLPFFLPKIFIEDLDSLLNNLEKIEQKCISLSNSISTSSSDEFRFLVEISKLKKRNVTTYQHGAMYDSIKYNFIDEFEKETTHFLSWKNKMSYNNYFKSFNFKKKNFYSKKQIIFFSQIKTLNITRYESQYINFSSNKSSILDIVQLYKNLNIELKNNFRIRNENHSFDWEYKDIFLKNLGETYFGSFVNRTSVLNEIKNSRILIIEGISTIFFEALTSGIPFFVILKENNYMFKDDVNKLFNELLGEKLLFKSAADCADFMNHNYYNISKFWQSETVQHLIEKLKNYFFYCDKNN
jgi:putative transferase (TIGR04331 family)